MPINSQCTCPLMKQSFDFNQRLLSVVVTLVHTTTYSSSQHRAVPKFIVS